MALIQKSKQDDIGGTGRDKTPRTIKLNIQLSLAVGLRQPQMTTFGKSAES